MFYCQAEILTLSRPASYALFSTNLLFPSPCASTFVYIGISVYILTRATGATRCYNVATVPVVLPTQLLASVVDDSPELGHQRYQLTVLQRLLLETLGKYTAKSWCAFSK